MSGGGRGREGTRMELTSAEACQNKLRENSSEADNKFEPQSYNIAWMLSQNALQHLFCDEAQRTMISIWSGFSIWLIIYLDVSNEIIFLQSSTR